MIFKIIKNAYGFQLHINFWRKNLILRLFKDFDTATTVGINNRTPEGKYVLFLDYDNILLEEQLIPELKYLQRKYRLGDLHILKSSQKLGNYHVIGLDKLTSREWMSIIEETSCDQNYKKVPLEICHKSWVLRILPKKISEAPELIKILTSNYQNREQSLAHAKLLNLLHGVNIKKFKRLDNNTNMMTTTYETINYIKEEKK